MTDGGRVIETGLCSECEDRPATVTGLCPVCERENRDGMVTDGGQTVVDHRVEAGWQTRELGDRSEVLVPVWADHIRTGDEIELETSTGPVTVEVIGFSKVPELYGLPTFVPPEELEDRLDPGKRYVVREEDLVDGGSP